MNQNLYPWDDEIMAEVRQNKANLLARYGGIDGLLRHLDDERPNLELEGWKFVDTTEISKKPAAVLGGG